MYKVNGYDASSLDGVDPLRVQSFTATGKDVSRILWNIHGIPGPSANGTLDTFTWFGSDAQTIVAWLNEYD